MNHIHYQLALARRDDFLREAAKHRLVERTGVSLRFGHLLLSARHAAPASVFKGRRAAAHNEA